MSDFQAWNGATHPIVRLTDDWNELLDHGLVKAASYIIRKNGTFTEAIDGNTGKIFSNGINAATVWQTTINNLPLVNGTRGGKIVFYGEMDINTQLTFLPGTIGSPNNAEVVVEGLGTRASWINWTGAAGTACFNITDNYGCKFRNFHYNGNSNIGKAFEIFRSQGTVLENLEIFHCASPAVNWHGVGSGGTVRDCEMTDNTIDIQLSDYVNNVDFYHNVIETLYTNFSMFNVFGGSFAYINIANNGFYPIGLHSVAFDPTTEAENLIIGDGAISTNYCNNVLIDNCRFIGGATRAITLDYARGCRIINPYHDSSASGVIQLTVNAIQNYILADYKDHPDYLVDDAGSQNLIEWTAGFSGIRRQSHPTTVGWGNFQRGWTWFCSTHGCQEMWNGYEIVAAGFTVTQATVANGATVTFTLNFGFAPLVFCQPLEDNLICYPSVITTTNFVINFRDYAGATPGGNHTFAWVALPT